MGAVFDYAKHLETRAAGTLTAATAMFGILSALNHSLSDSISVTAQRNVLSVAWIFLALSVFFALEAVSADWQREAAAVEIETTFVPDYVKRTARLVATAKWFLINTLPLAGAAYLWPRSEVGWVTFVALGSTFLGIAVRILEKNGVPLKVSLVVILVVLVIAAQVTSGLAHTGRWRCLSVWLCFIANGYQLPIVRRFI